MAKSEPILTLTAYDSDGATLADLALPGGATATTIADAVVVVRVPTTMHPLDVVALQAALQQALKDATHPPQVIAVPDSVTLWRLVPNKPEVEAHDDHH